MRFCENVLQREYLLNDASRGLFDGVEFAVFLLVREPVVKSKEVSESNNIL